MVGDKVADRYAVPPAGTEEATSASYAKRCPAALAREWDSYCNEFISHYHLDESVHDSYMPAEFAASATGLLASENGGILVVADLDQPRLLRAALADGAGKSELQKEYCHKTVEDFKAATVAWMLHGSKPQRFTSPWGPPVEAERTPEQRVHDYVAQRERIRKAQAGELTFSLNTLFGADKTKDLLAEKGEVSRTRADLARELDTRTARLKEALRDILTPEQAQKYGPMPEPVKATGVMSMSRLEWIDFMVRWGLVLSGAGLILGLFTRTSCVLGAFLLLSFYLAAMPLPGVLEAVRVEGYPYVNKNIVEMLALLTLATTPSGRWAGLDAFNPFNWRSAKPKAPPPPPDRYNGTVVKGPAPAAIPSHVPSRR
jgi:uncharacterized membrane protein YphA (DoxX/SURF4 family)